MNFWIHHRQYLQQIYIFLVAFLKLKPFSEPRVRGFFCNPEVNLVWRISVVNVILMPSAVYVLEATSTMLRDPGDVRLGLLQVLRAAEGVRVS